MDYAIKHQVTLSTLNCCSCGVVFAMPEALSRRLRSSGDWFYCPNGHRQHFSESEADRLRTMLEEANRMNTDLANDLSKERGRAAKLAHENRRLMKRVTAGVCPCCNRTFANLARHMASQHKGDTP